METPSQVPYLAVTDTALASALTKCSREMQSLRENHRKCKILVMELASCSIGNIKFKLDLWFRYPFDKKFVLVVRKYDSSSKEEQEDYPNSCWKRFDFPLPVPETEKAVNAVVDAIRRVGRILSLDNIQVGFIGSKKSVFTTVHENIKKDTDRKTNKKETEKETDKKEDIVSMSIPVGSIGEAVYQCERIMNEDSPFGKTDSSFPLSYRAIGTASYNICLKVSLPDGPFFVEVIRKDRKSEGKLTRSYPFYILDKNYRDVRMSFVESVLDILENLHKDEKLPVNVIFPEAKAICDYVDARYEKEPSGKVFELDVIGKAPKEAVIAVSLNELKRFVKDIDAVRVKDKFLSIANVVRFFGTDRDLVLLFFADSSCGSDLKAFIFHNNRSAVVPIRSMDGQTFSAEEISTFLEFNCGFLHTLQEFSNHFWDGRKIRIVTVE